MIPGAGVHCERRGSRTDRSVTLPPPPGRRPEGGVGALDVSGGQGHWEGIQSGTRDLGSHGGTGDSGSHGGTGDSGGHGGTRDLGGHGGAILNRRARSRNHSGFPHGHYGYPGQGYIAPQKKVLGKLLSGGLGSGGLS